MKKMGTALTSVRKVEAEMSRPREKPKSGWEVILKKGLMHCFPTGVPRNRRVSKNVVRGF
jgi:hypothetical protein